MIKSLLFFEEYDSNLSYALRKRNDINVTYLRTDKSLKFFNKDYLDKYNDSYEMSYSNDLADEVTNFKKWMDQKNIKYDYFLNDSEFYMDYSNKIAQKIGLESLNSKQIEWVRDKVAMKDRFNQIGLKTVDYQIVTCKKDIYDFMKKHIGEPIIFKPRSSMNSKDVYKIDSIEDVDKLDFYFTSEKYMVESYCYDQEWSIESLVQDGTVIDSYVTYIPNRTLWAAMDNKLNCHMTLPTIPNYFKFVPKEFIQKIVDGMSLKNGAMTIEVFIDKDGNVMPSELGWRLPGCQATKNHGISYGFDMYNSLIDIAIHKPVKLKYRDPIVCVGDLYLPNKEGIIKDVTSLDNLLSMDGVIDGELFVKKGEYQKKRRVGNDASGWVQVLGKDKDDTFNKMKNVYNSFKLEVENEFGGIQYVK